MTSDHFSRIRQAKTAEEATSIGQELLQELGGSFNDQTETLRELIAISEGEVTTFLNELIALREQSNANEANKYELLKEFTELLSGKEDAEIDSLTCDFYAKVTPLMAEKTVINTRVSDLTLKVQSHLQQSLFEKAIDERNAVHESDLERLTDFAANIAAKATLIASGSTTTDGPPPTL